MPVSESESLLTEEVFAGALDEYFEKAKEVFDGAATGDPVCCQLLEMYTECLADGFANLINIFGPAYVCIGGGVSHAGDQLLQPLQKKTKEFTFAKAAARQPQIILAKLHNDAGILGAALLEC